MATAKIDLLGPNDIPLVANLYNQIYRPTHEADFFRRRFLGRYNPLILVASLDENPVGFFLGFELKPDTFFSWLYGVLPDFRRKAIASQLMDAVHDWVATARIRADPLRVPQPASADAAHGHQPSATTSSASAGTPTAATIS